MAWAAFLVVAVLVQAVPPEPVAEPPAVPVEEPVQPIPAPDPGMAATDPRVQLLSYNPDQIVQLPVGIGFASVIELGPDERVENVVVGNSAAWQVTANRKGDRIVVKPLADAVPTNLIVLTGSRRYMFMLYPGYGDQTAFVTRFRYPSPAEEEFRPVAVRNYSFRGSKGLFPTAMYNDGQRTVITWARETPLPAVFAMNDGRHEQLVNGRMVGDDFVVEGVAPRYKFRLGPAEATAVRRAPRRR